MKASASSSTGYYIDQFSTTYDKYNKRQNKYVDIKYGEMNITFNENKILVNLLVHVAGNFNLPAGSLVANLIMPGQDLSQINLYKQNTGIPSTFAYGYPDASSVYSGQFTLDVNEDKFLSNNINSSFQINTNFSLNTSQLNNIGEDQINSSSLSNFISELQNVSLVFNIDLYQKNAIDLSLSNIINVNQISSIWLASQTVDTNNNSVGSQQKNTTTPFQFLGFDYTNLNTGFSNLFTIKKTNNLPIKIQVSALKVCYYIQNQLYESDPLQLSDNITIENNAYTYALKGYQTEYDTNSNACSFKVGENGIYFDQDINGYYLVNVNVVINGSNRTYTLKNYFNFVKNQKIQMDFLTSDDNTYKIKDSTNYYEIQA
ncbi:MAG: hypothetical protein HUJ42_03570 [Malacoplasma sp.]|nr:hypothetical protein [Malacoplasma sp.]